MTVTQRWSLWAAILGSGIVFLDSTVVTVALPQIGSELSSTLLGTFEAQSYVYNGYLLALSALLVVAGAVTDSWGRRRSFALGLAGFGITSLMCGLATSMEMLIGFRILQGAAGAFVVPGSLAIIRASFREEEQGRAFGMWAGASAITSIIGPFVGGLLVDGISWRAAFFINLPLVAVALWATTVHVAESREEATDRHLDWVGAGIVALAVGGLAFGAIRGQESRWEDMGAYVGLALGAAATVLLPVWLLRARRPLVPPALFRSRTFTMVNVVTLLVYGAFYVVSYVLAIHLQGTLGYDATAAGIALVPSMVFLAAFSSKFGELATRHGPRWFMAGGAATMAAGVLWLSFLGVEGAAWAVDLTRPSTLVPPTDYLTDVFGPVAVFGIGLMILVAPLTTALMTSVPRRRSGIASAINNAVSRVGPQLASAAIFVLVTGQFFGALAERAPGLEPDSPSVRESFSPFNRPGPDASDRQVAAAREASAEAFELAMLVSAGLLAAGAVASAAGIRPERVAPGGATEPVLTPPPACGPLEVDCLPEEAA